MKSPVRACADAGTHGAPPRKVCQVLYSGLGGHGAVALALADTGTRRGWEPVLGFFGVEPLVPAYADACARSGLSFEYFGVEPRRSWTAWRRIHRWLGAVRPDAIVLHSLTALVPCWLHAARRGIPLVVVEHQPNALKHRVHVLFSRAAMHLADAVVVLTPEYEDELRQLLGRSFRPDRVRSIPNGVDTTLFAPRAAGARADGRIRLGMAARFSPTKRQGVLVSMMEELRRVAPEVTWELSLAGEGETHARVRDAVERAALAGSVELPGRLDGADLARWFRSLDVYLHASSGETLSMSLLQAMATRLPIVASAIPGISNLLGADPPCGVLVDGDDPRRFAEAVRAVAGAPERAAALGAAGRRLVEARFGRDAMFDAYDALVRGVA